MASIIRRLLDVRTDEFVVFSVFFLFYFLFGFQISIGLAVSESLFLAEVGPSFLPYMYIFNSLIIIFVSSIYSYFTEKLSIPALFKAVLFFFSVLVFGIRFGIFADFRAWGMPIAFPLLHTLFVMFTNMIPNNFRAFYGLYLDVLQSKRLVPIILTGGRYGGMVGGFSIPFLISLTGGVANLLYVWIGAIFGSVFFISFIQVWLRNYLLESSDTHRKRKSPKGGIRHQKGLSLLKSNHYVAAFALFTFIVIFLRNFQDYQYSVVFREAYPSREELASFLGLFTGIATAISLLIQTFVTPRLLRQFGVGTANLLYPFTSLIGLAGMSISPTFYSAIFLRFNNKNLQESIRNPINALLYNALPTNIRSRVGALMAGHVIATASIVSGLMLLAIKPTGLALLPLSPRWLALVTFVIAIAYLAAGFFLRNEYGAALRKMLEDRNLGLFQFAQEGFGSIDQESTAILVRNLHEGDNDLCIYAAGMLAETDSSLAAKEILEEIPKRTGLARCDLVRLLAQIPSSKEDESIKGVWSDLLQSENSEYRIAAMDAISTAGLIDEYAERIQACLNFSSPNVRTRAVQLLVRSDDLFWLASGLQTLHTMLETGQSEEKVSALHCIGELDNPRFIRRVLPYLHEEDFMVREAAMAAAERLLPSHSTREDHRENVIQTALRDPHPAIRRRGIRLLGKKGTRTNFERLLVALTDPDEKVRHEAVASLKEIKRKGSMTLEGGAFLAFLARWLRSTPNGSPQEITDEQLRDGLISFSLEHLREVYELIGHLYVISHAENRNAYVMLRKVLQDKVQDWQRLILELLGVIADEKIVDTVSESLESGERTSRAIAIETLSNVSSIGDTRQLILMLEPLLLGASSAEILAEGQKHWDISVLDFEKVLQIHIESLEPWSRAVAVNAAGNYLASSVQQRGRQAQNISEWLLRFEALAKDENLYVREAAVSAIGLLEFPGDKVSEILDSALGDSEERVRNQANRALKRFDWQKTGHPQTLDLDREMLSTIEKALFLKEISLFESMTADQLRILSNISTEIHIPEGKIIFEEGDPCDYLYVIVDGDVEIVRAPATSAESLLAVLKAPSSFGEIALFGNEGRSAAARAGSTLTLLGIEKDPLLLLIRAHPEISIAIISQLSSIIRHQDEARVASVQSEQGA